MINLYTDFKPLLPCRERTRMDDWEKWCNWSWVVEVCWYNSYLLNDSYVNYTLTTCEGSFGNNVDSIMLEFEF
jgi:hypothetical protein